MKNSIKNKISYRLVFLTLAAGFISALSLISCATLQDVVVNFDGSAKYADIRNIEEKFAFIDAESVLKNDISSKEHTLQCSRLLEEIDNIFAKGQTGKAESARLWALRGHTQLLSGAKSHAAVSYKEAKKNYRDDIAVHTLAYRLGMVNKIDLGLAQGTQDKARLVLENAVANYRSGKYMEAAADFDSAFIDLPEYYRAAYGEIRARAWELRNVSASAGSNTNALLQKKEITAGQMLLIAQDTGTLLYNYTAGKKLSENQLYSKVSSAGLLDSVSAVSAKPGTTLKDEIIVRIKCARFLWNLYNKKGGSENSIKYSRRYRQLKLPSPVQDVPSDSEDFDAVLGCAESELMELPDGENFLPAQKVSALECREYIENLFKRIN